MLEFSSSKFIKKLSEIYDTEWKDEQQKVLHSPFSIEIHKKTFTNYLEIVIDSEGVCHYAVPSHNGVLEQLLLTMKDIDWDIFNYNTLASDLCPEDRYAEYNEWLCEQTGCVMVWGKPRSVVIGEANDKQIETLKLLQKEGLF